MNIFNHFSLWNKQRVRILRPILYLPFRYSKKVSIYFYVIFAILTISIIANFQTNLANTFVAAIFLGITIVVFRFWRKKQKKYFNGIEYALNYMVVSNGLFESQVINGKEKIINYIPLQFQ